MFVEIVSEAAKFFRLLFTPCALYVHKGKKYIKYKRILKNGGDDKDMEWLKVCRQKTWDNFDNPKGDPDWSKVSNELLDELDELNGRELERLGGSLFIYDRDEQHDYWDAVRSLLKKHVVEGAEDEVASQILKKLKWYLRGSKENNDRLVIPILTPKMLDALAIHISARAKGYEEVRDVLCSRLKNV